MKREELTEVEQSMLNGMNKRAMLIGNLEEYLMYHKISIDMQYVDSLPDKDLNELVAAWSPERQENLRKTIEFETESQADHTINGSKGEDMVSQLTFKDQLDIMSRILNDVAADYQFDINSPDYLGFLNCSPIDDNWPEIERYIMVVFLSSERAILNTMLEERGLDIEAGADLEEIIFIVRR